MIERYRDHAANERTFLAWVRTAIAVTAFGLGAARLAPGTDAVWSELALLGSGGIVVLLAFMRMRRLKARIASANAEPEEGLAADGLLIALILALFAMLAFFGLHVS